LGQEYDIGVEMITKTRDEYQSAAHFASGLPVAPAVMVEDEIAGQGPAISEEKLEEIIRRRLGLPPSETQT